MSKKAQLIEAIIVSLNREVEMLSQSARSAYEAATHEESKAEDSHDTRGLEAAYLAGAQNARIEDLKRTIHYLQHDCVRDFALGSAIEIGALIQLESNQRRFHYFVTARGGGKSLQFEGKTIQLITPQSPLGEEMMGKYVGDEVEGQVKSRVYKVVSIE